jgi:hypothetical protein
MHSQSGDWEREKAETELLKIPIKNHSQNIKKTSAKLQQNPFINYLLITLK